MSCSYCAGAAVTSSLVSIGDRPVNPKHECGMSDSRKVAIVRACPVHVGRLGGV